MEHDEEARLSVMTRRRLGGYVESVPQRPGASHRTRNGQELTEMPSVLPGGAGSGTVATANVSRRRRKKRVWYKRPLRVVFLAVTTLLLLVAGAGLLRFQSTMDSLHAVSTPPSEVTDNTYEEGAATTGAAASPPLVVNTGPARAYLNEQRELGLVAAAPGSGFGSSVGGFFSNSGDALSSTISALGLSGGIDNAITILLMGVDARPGSAIDIGVRPDVLALLRLDPVTGDCQGLSIPRDTRVDLPGYGKSKINHALMVGGIPYQLRVVEEFTGVEIDHYVLIDFVGFQRIVDQIGGIEVTINQDLTKGGNVAFAKGTYHLDGEAALRFARFRSFDSDQDIGRVQRQWGLIKGISNALGGQDLVAQLNSVLPIVEGHIRTDMSAELMSEIVKTYGGKCSSPGDADAAILRGSLVQFRDPILNEVVYYNVVSEEAVQERISILYGEQLTQTEPSRQTESTPRVEETPAIHPPSTPVGAGET